MAKKKILIVSYTFPPSKGIGGKRWSKFSKYLSKSGYEVHVLCHKRPSSSESWTYQNVFIHEFGGFYPTILSKNPKSISEKLRYRFWVFVLPLLTKGSIYDKSIFAKKSFLKIASSIVSQHDIQNIIVTCAPFNLAHYALTLKQKFDITLTVDLRDPWTWGKGYGYSIMPPQRLAHDKNIEKLVIANADFVCSPSEEILKHLENEYPKSERNEFLHIPHGIDTESFPMSRKEFTQKERRSTLKIVYAGTLYEGYSEFISAMMKAMKGLESDIMNEFHFDIFSTSDHKHLVDKVEVNDLSKKIKFHSAIKEKVLLSKYPSYDYTLIFFPEKFKDFITTKIYELVYANLPIIYIGYPGKLSDFLTENQLGVFIEYQHLKEQFADTIENLNQREFNSDFEVEKFTFEKVTEKLVENIKI